MGQKGFEVILQSWKLQGIIRCLVDTNWTPKEGA
jgi:hypothetical protein